jgi:hypothetical protein
LKAAAAAKDMQKEVEISVKEERRGSPKRSPVMDL